MIRLKNYKYEDDVQEAVLLPMSGQWYFIQKGDYDLIECFRSWTNLQTALYDLVDLEDWEVIA